MAGTRDSFVAHFGEADAAKVEAAAAQHKNSVHDRPGSDPFRWAVAICIGLECFSKYRDFHHITATWECVRPWIIEHGDLATHDGDVDFIPLAIDVYREYLKPEDACPPTNS